MGLQRWGAASPTFPHDVPVGCDAAMLALKNAFDADGRRRPRATSSRSASGPRTFAVTVGDGRLDIRRGAAERPAAVIETEPTTLEQVAFGMRSLGDAERPSDLRIEGDHAVAERFSRCSRPSRPPPMGV